MSPRAERSRLARRLHDGEGGFSLIEVMVAMLVFTVLAVASLGFVMTSLSATALARTDAVAKNLNQQVLESMRTLPYSVHAPVSAAPDLLDTYYTSTSMTTGGTGDSRFVPSGGARDVGRGDPASGPFFRRVLTGPPGFADYTLRVTSQFLGPGGAVLPSPVFVSTSTGLDGLPPSPTIAVRVTALWQTSGRPRSFTVESRITDAASRPQLVTTQARMSLLRFTGVLPDERELVSEAGVLNLDGSLSSATVASAVAHGARASVAGGAGVDGATGTVSAPPSQALTVDSVGPRSLTDGTVLAEFSGTSVTGLSVSTQGGQPAAGTATAPVSAVLHGSGLGGDTYFRAGRDLATPGTRRGLVTDPVVRALAPGCGGSCTAVSATGRIASTGGSAPTATAALAGRVEGTIAVLPTTAYPDGLIQLQLTSFSLECTSNKSASPRSRAAVSYAGVVRHRVYDPVGGARWSADIPISSAQDTDPLGAIDPMTVVGVDGAGVALHLRDYVQSWSSLTRPAATAATVVEPTGTAVSLNLPGVFTLTSAPLRSTATSTIGLQLGASSCTTSDLR